MRGCERKVECFSLFERYVTLPVGTWLIALEQSPRSQCGRLLRTLQSHYFVLREKKETFSVASLQLTVQLPCGNVFSSFILPLRACQRRSFHDVSTVGWEQKEVSTIDKRTDHRKALDRRRFVRDCPNPRPDQRRLVVCSPRSWFKLRELVEVWSSP